MKTFKKLSAALSLVIGAGWAALYFSNHAALIWGSVNEEKLVNVLECHYFTGTGFVTRKHLYNETIGRQTCPRLLDLGD